MFTETTRKGNNQNIVLLEVTEKRLVIYVNFHGHVVRMYNQRFI